MDVDLLREAIENERNSSVLGLTTKKIQRNVLQALKALPLSRDEKANYFQKLNGYLLIDELKDIRCGAFVKWIPLNDDEPVLNNGGMVCDIRISDNGVTLVCKTFRHRYYQIRMDDSLVFQKLSDQERVLLSALDHLDRN